MIVHVNNADLYCITSGQGAPLMLMHGGMGLDHTYFRPWLDPLAGQMQLVYYDHRGNGRSAPVDDFSGFDRTIWADDADALRRHLGHEKVVVFGHSAGGLIAMDYARRYGNRLAGLILCCTIPVMDYPEVVMANAGARCTPEQLPLVLKGLTEPLPDSDLMRTVFERILSLYFKSYDPAIGAAVAQGIRYNHQAFNYYMATMLPGFNSTAWLGDIRVPTLVIGGRHDWIMPPAPGAERLHAAIPGSQLAIFENSGHFPFIEEQDPFNKTVKEWAAKIRLA